MTLIAFAGEDENHFRVVTSLVDDALVTNIDWVRDVLESCRTWRGLHGEERWYKYAPDDAYDLRPVTIDGVTIKLHGPIAGKPLKPEAGMWRKVLLLFCHRDPRPDIVVLARDLDGYPDRRDGLEQACTDLPSELTLKVNGLKIGIAIGFNGLLVAVQRFNQRLLVAVGRWTTQR